VPGLAGPAIQQGRHAARNLLQRVHGQPALPFRYRDRGAFAVIGRGAAVGTLGLRLRLDGVVAWLLWLTVHLVFLVGFRNRVSVLMTWAYAFFTRWRPMWLITGRPASSRQPAATAPAVHASPPAPAREAPTLH
jgi:NADH dehydrogenase